MGDDMESRFQSLEQSHKELSSEVQSMGKVLHQIQKQLHELVSLKTPAGVDSSTTPSARHHAGSSTDQTFSGTVPRFSKLDFPTYDGNSDPLAWLNRCEHFFDQQRTPESEKVGLAGFHMLEEAQFWYSQLKSKGFLPWATFRQRCNLRFGPPKGRGPLGELMQVRQTETVDQYQKLFQAKLARAGTSIYDDQHVEFFISGLADAIRHDVQMKEPVDLDEAMNLARAFELKLHDQLTAAPTRTSWEGSQNSPTAVVPPASGSFPSCSTVSKSSSAASVPFVRKLSKVELAERRAKGLCYNCDESYSSNHKCKTLFWIEVYDPDPPTAEVAPGIGSIPAHLP